MKPSDFQKTVQCRFESCLKKVVRSVVKDYYKELNRRKNKEISFSELPDVLVDKMAVWDDYETDYTIFSVYVCEMASHGDCTPRPFQKKASDPRSDPRATVGKVVLPRPILTE